MNKPIVIESWSAQVAADPGSFFKALREGHSSHVSDMGSTVAIVETDDEAEDMTPLRSEKTGIDNTIFISTTGYAPHAARIKIAVDPPDTFNATSKSASMAIHDGSITGEYLTPPIVEQAKRWIDLNRDVLLEYWNQKIDTAQLIERLKPV